MAIGTGIILLVAGLILATNVVEVDLKYIDDNALGVILIVAGVLAILLSLVINAQRQRRTTVVQDDRAVVEERHLR